MKIRIYGALLILLGWLAPGGDCFAGNTINGLNEANQTAPNLTDPICLGDVVVYSLDITGPDYLGGVDWYYQWTGCTPPFAEKRLVDTNGSNISGVTFQSTESKAGTCKLRVVVHCSTGQPGGAYDVTATFNVTVLPPDTVTLANGAQVLNQSLATVPEGPGAAPNIRVVFNIQRGNRVLNCGGTPIENVLRSAYTDAFMSAVADIQWTDAAPYMSCTLGAVIDGKGIINSAGYRALATNTLVEHFDQFIGLKVATGCGGTLEIHFPNKFKFKMIKIDNSNWQLILVP